MPDEDGRYPVPRPGRNKEYEFKRSRKRGLLWRTVFSPVALTADIGAAMFDPNAEEGLYSEVKDRVEERN